MDTDTASAYGYGWVLRTDICTGGIANLSLLRTDISAQVGIANMRPKFIYGYGYRWGLPTDAVQVQVGIANINMRPKFKLELRN